MWCAVYFVSFTAAAFFEVPKVVRDKTISSFLLHNNMVYNIGLHL